MKGISIEEMYPSGVGGAEGRAAAAATTHAPALVDGGAPAAADTAVGAHAHGGNAHAGPQDRENDIKVFLQPLVASLNESFAGLQADVAAHTHVAVKAVAQLVQHMDTSLQRARAERAAAKGRCAAVRGAAREFQESVAAALAGAAGGGGVGGSEGDGDGAGGGGGIGAGGQMAIVGAHEAS